MEKKLFQGASPLTLDTKGRISIPTRFREILQCNAPTETQVKVTITKHPDGCLLLFPWSEWEIFRDKIVALPMDAHWWRRIFLGNASEVELDSGGRVLVSPALRQAAVLEKEVMFLGMGRHFEIWNAQTYAEKEQVAISKGMPDALKQLSF